jgi:hypothetical protein
MRPMKYRFPLKAPRMASIGDNAIDDMFDNECAANPGRLIL